MNIFELLIIQPIFNLLTVIYTLIPGGDFGIAIIVFTVLVRLLMYPLVKRQLHQTRIMRRLQPELKKIKKAAKGNRQVEALQMMELYKRYGVSPFRSIGIMLLQLPIFIGLFFAIRIYTIERDRIELFTYSFLENIGPIRALIDNPDEFQETLFGVIDLSKNAVSTAGIDIFLVLLVLLASVTQYIMSKQVMPHDPKDQPKGFRDIMKEAAEGKQADQSEMNAAVMTKMIKIMPIVLFFVMINLPGALALYYTISNIVAVLQQSYLLRQDEIELEELAEEVKNKKRAKQGLAPNAEPEVEVIPPQKTSKKTKASSTGPKSKKATPKNANVTRIVAKDSKRRRK